MKREAGENPARTRHRDSQVEAQNHWVTGKGAETSERLVGRPAFRSTGIIIQATRNWQYETKSRVTRTDFTYLMPSSYDGGFLLHCISIIDPVDHF